MIPHNAILTAEAMELMGYHAAIGIDDVLNRRQPQWPVRIPHLHNVMHGV